MSEREDEILERLLQRLENPDVEDPGLDLSPEERRTWQEYSELASLLPYALDPIEPRSTTKEAVLSAIRDEDRPIRSTVVFPGADAPSPHSVRSVQLIAAVLGVVAIGLSVLAGWMFRDSQMHQARVAELGRALESSLAREESLASLDTEMGDFRRVMTAPGMRVCPLKPRGEAPTQPVARGAVYFDAKESRWFLTARDLAPCDRGSQYTVWFLLESGEALPAGSLFVEAGADVTFGSGQLPENMRAVLLTLEEDPTVAAPTGPAILYGDESQEML